MAKTCFPIFFSFLVALHLSHLNSVKASPQSSDAELLFDSSSLEEYEMPPACGGMSFCFIKGDNYPEEKIAELLTDMRELGVDNFEAQTSINRKKRSIGESKATDDEIVLCPSNSTDIPIYYIVDTNDRVRVVVQSPNRFMQTYTVRWCLNQGRITSSVYNIFNGFECVTTMMDLDFFVLGDDMHPNKMEIARPKGGIPVCCKCRSNFVKPKKVIYE